MYVPQPIGIRPTRPVRSARDTGCETLALTQDELEPDPARRPLLLTGILDHKASVLYRRQQS
jgi:hypothetical protein